MLVTDDNSRSPRLLLVLASNKRRGAEVLGERLAEGLSSVGWLVNTVCLTQTDDTVTVKAEPLTNVDAATQGRFHPSLVRALRACVDSFSPDVVLANGGSTLRYSVLAMVGMTVPLAYTAIGEPTYWVRAGLSRMLNRVLLRRTGVIVAVSRRTRDQLVELDAALSDRISVVRPGLPESFLDAESSTGSGPLRLVQVGSLSLEKDPMLSLDVVAHVPDVRLRLVGSGPLQEELAQRTRELGLSARVEFLGPVDDVTPHFAWADALLLTSVTEGLPGVVLEAAAASTPAVGVDVGGVGEAIADGVTGVVVNRDVESLVAAVQVLDRVELREMGDAARTRVQVEFGFDETVSRYSEILSDLA